MLNSQIGIRLSESDRNLLEKVCSSRGEVISVFARRAIRKELASLGYYSDDVKKALRITV